MATTVNIRRVSQFSELFLSLEIYVGLTYTNMMQQDNPDPFYRYKMERLQAKIEGKGNGIKTVVVNLNNVAQSLGRPPACKYTMPADLRSLVFLPFFYCRSDAKASLILTSGN